MTPFIEPSSPGDPRRATGPEDDPCPIRSPPRGGSLLTRFGVEIARRPPRGPESLGSGDNTSPPSVRNWTELHRRGVITWQPQPAGDTPRRPSRARYRARLGPPLSRRSPTTDSSPTATPARSSPRT